MAKKAAKKSAIARPRYEVSDGARIAQIISKKWICNRCGLFCMEHVPIMKRGMKSRHLKVHKIFCSSLCHERADWTFREFKSPYRL